MKKSILMLIILISIASMPQVSLAEPADQGLTKIETISIMLKKLRKIMAQTKEMDALADVGVSAKDIKEMKSAVNYKAQRMIKQIVAEVREIK